MGGRISIILAICVSLIATSAFAQSTGAIVGIVRDQTGAILPGVGITVSNAATQESRQIVTDEGGRYSAQLLPPGKKVA